MLGFMDAVASDGPYANSLHLGTPHHCDLPPALLKLQRKALYKCDYYYYYYYY